MNAQRRDLARVMFLVRVPVDRGGDFLAAYEQMRLLVAAVPGHRVDQVCQSAADPEQWLITSEWDSLEAFEAWENDEAHLTLVGPLHACITEMLSMRFLIRAQTSLSQPPSS